MDTDVNLARAAAVGFGRGNYNDRLMQMLAQNGYGNAHYIDTLNEARKALALHHRLRRQGGRW